MNPLLEINNLSKNYKLNNGQVLKAIENISFTISKGETLGLIGESGCGKTTLARCLMGLEKPSSGEVVFLGKNFSAFKKKEIFYFKKEVQIVFQNAQGSLNPKLTIGEQLREPLLIHKIIEKKYLLREVYRLLDLVGLTSDSYEKYPYQFSGGQQQRIAIARALALNPQLLICDEPTSALDVSIQAQILNLLRDLQKEYHLTYLFITHDLALIKYFSDRVAVMNRGKIVKLEKTDLFFNQ